MNDLYDVSFVHNENINNNWNKTRQEHLTSHTRSLFLFGISFFLSFSLSQNNPHTHTGLQTHILETVFTLRLSVLSDADLFSTSVYGV